MTATPAEIARRAVAEHLATLPAAELLRRFAANRDAEAFAALVHQFGPLVLGTCRRVLGPSADADDAFQTVFVELARRAISFRDAAALPAWLHRVALRVARKALARREPLRGLTPPGSPEPVDPADPFADVAWKDVRRVLDEELERLPEKLRGPVVLCWLDGLTQDEAAARLGLSRNTLKRRLDAGREVLRSRLVRRGVTPAVVAAMMLPPAPAAVPSALVNDTLGLVAATKPVAGGLPRLVAFVALTAVAACGLAVVTAGHAPPEPAPQPRLATPLVTVAGTDPTLPSGVVATFGSTHFRVPGEFSSSAMSADGKLLAIGDNPVRVYEAATWKLVRQFAVEADETSGERQSVWFLAFSPDGRYLGGSNWQFAYVWDLQNGRFTARIDGEKPGQWAKFCTFTPEGHFALSEKAKLRFFDPATGREVKAIDAGYTVALSPDGSVFARLKNYHDRMPLGENEILVFGDVATGKELFTLDGLTKWVGGERALAFAPDGKSFAVIPAERDRIEVWDVAKKAPRLTIRPPAKLRRAWGGQGEVGFTADGKILFAQEEGDVLRWDAATGKQLPRLRAGSDPWLTGLYALPDGKTLLTPARSGWVRLWEAATAQERPIPGRYWDAAFAITPDGKIAAVGDKIGRIDLLDATTGKLIRTVRETGEHVRFLVFSPDGALLAVDEQRERYIDDHPRTVLSRVVVLRVSDGKEIGALGPKDETDPKSLVSLHALGFAHADDADLLIVNQSTPGVLPETRVWNIGTGKEVRRLESQAWRAVPSPDGKRLATDTHGEVVLLDTATGREVKRIVTDPEEKAKRSVTGGVVLAWSADGRTLAATLRQDNACVLDPTTGKERARFVLYSKDRPEYLKPEQHWPGRSYAAWALAVSPDGKRLAASALHGQYVALWDAETGKELARLDHGYRFQIRSVAFTPDGKAVFTFGDTGLGYRWDLEKLLAAQKK